MKAISGLIIFYVFAVPSGFLLGSAAVLPSLLKTASLLTARNAASITSNLLYLLLINYHTMLTLAYYYMYWRKLLILISYELLIVEFDGPI